MIVHSPIIGSLSVSVKSDGFHSFVARAHPLFCKNIVLGIARVKITYPGKYKSFDVVTAIKKRDTLLRKRAVKNAINNAEKNWGTINQKILHKKNSV